ncbi:hypothetical protein N0V92_004914 [Colletotrichum tropicale]|nr:hypothetical protein N0V92_004914 [Colletotrichum tropicale]
MDADGDDTFIAETTVDDGSVQPEDHMSAPDSNGAGLHPPVASETAPIPQTRPDARVIDPSASNALSHEIGMVSLGSNQDPKYIGPSSGYFLARLMLNSTRQEDQAAWPSRTPAQNSPFPTALVEAMQGPLPLPGKEQARQLAEMYFDVINVQYPILHQPTFMMLLDQVYENGLEAEHGPTGAFQVFMVLALGATVLSRRTRARLSGESYCLSALEYFDRINVENSIRGLQSGSASVGRMAFSIHLFRLAKLNSEFKYVANSIVRDTPRYAYPAVIDINEWQNGMLQQLDEWHSTIPQHPGMEYVQIVCQIRYHGLRMLLLRPSPAIPNPSSDSLRKCFDAACQGVRLLDQLYKQNMLIHAWNTPHSIVLSIITMLYCIKMVPEIARQTALDSLMSDFSAGLGVLAATGEHWSGAKRCRDILDDMIRATVRWIKDMLSQPATLDVPQHRRSSRLESTQAPPLNPYDPNINGASAGRIAFSESLSHPITMASMTSNGPEAFLPQDPFESFLSNTAFGDQLQMGEGSNLDSIMRGLFDDFIPTYPSFS